MYPADGGSKLLRNTHSVSLGQDRTGARVTSFMAFPDHTQWSITVRRTPLDEGSARRRDVYLQRTTFKESDIHSLCRTRTRSASKKSATDPRFRPLGYSETAVPVCHTALHQVADDRKESQPYCSVGLCAVSLHSLILCSGYE